MLQGDWSSLSRDNRPPQGACGPVSVSQPLPSRNTQMSAKTFTTVLALSLAGLASAAGFTALTGAQEMPPAEKPTAHHAMIVKGAGHWEGTLTVHQPDAPEMQFPCQETVTALGQFWTESEFHCDMGFMKFQGSSTLGYDALAGEAVGTWIDDSKSFMAVMRGTVDPKTGTYEMKWKAPVAEQDNRMVNHRSVTTVKGDALVMKFFMDIDDNESHFMTISMERQKADGHDGDHGHDADHRDADHDADHGKKKGGR